jgi:hypothetical protein
MDDRVLFSLKAGLVNGEANSHIFPAVIELFSAVETDDIRSAPRAICRLGSAGWGERKGCPVMGTTKKGTEQRIKHENEPPRIPLDWIQNRSTRMQQEHAVCQVTKPHVRFGTYT